MNENTILNEARQLIMKEEIEKAYNLLAEKKEEINTVGPLYYNALSCYAALIDKKEEAIKWLEEAISERGIFYGPAVFDDTDYETIRDDIRFKECVKTSAKLYEKAKINASPVFTWSEKTSDKLVIALHGNYQNNKHAKEQWKFFKDQNYQIEYLQSSVQETTGHYIWDMDNAGPKELKEAMAKCSSAQYKEQILCGFSAGCGTIINAIVNKDIECTAIILQSPWIPMIEKSLDDILKVLKEQNIKTLLICDTEDTACFTLAEELYAAGIKNNLNIKKEWTTGIGHTSPENLDEIIIKFLK